MPEPPLTLVLAAPEGAQPTGVPLHISVEVRNVSNQPLWIVGVLDGSETGFRYPRYLPQIAGPPQPPRDEEIYDMAAPLRIQDFRRLAPGDGFDPTRPSGDAAYQPLATFATFSPTTPGRYELRLTLDTDSQADEQWLGIVEYPGKEAVLERLAQVPRLRVDSNIITVEVH
jgi:hypothetical protein